MRAHPGLTQHVESHTLTQLLTALLSRDQDLYRPIGSPWSFHEYGAYVGSLASALALVGAASSPRRAGPWLLAGVTLLLLSMGNAFGAISPWTLIHNLPVFSSERVAPS